ncbi:unnamed protein product, partial [Mesorhabditis belari]|uniref:Transmembrane protein 208 n=1 Tax=Mesorhabditis belari TaxID=2138241 RepID=A0AAF3EJ81_9BILA
MEKPKGKQGTKGQKEIYKENKTTIQGYGLAALISSGAYFLCGFFLWQVTQNEWVWWGVTFFMQLGALLMMKTMARASFDDRGHLVDAGLDLNDPQAFGEYCKDSIILATAVQALALYTAYAYLLLLAIPGYVGYKILFSFVIPWATAPSATPEQGEMDDKKNRRREKIKFARR